MKSILKSSITIGIGTTLISSIYYAPKPDNAKDDNVKKICITVGEIDGKVNQDVDIKDIYPLRNDQTGLFSPKEEPIPLQFGRIVAFSFVTFCSNFVLRIFNDTKIVGNLENYEHLMDLVKNRPKTRPLITVANHTSVLDDPGLMSWIVGKDPIFQQNHRWGICKQEVCFNNMAKAAFCGLGQALPIRKGLGLDQPLFRYPARRLVDGGWVHVFPEAMCNQSGQLGRGLHHFECRDESISNQVGVLKWGVGKLIAHVRDKETGKPPIVIPYYHVGMHQLFPQHNREDDNSLLSSQTWRILGFKRFPIRVRFGKEIDFSDLFQEYEHKHGPLRISYVSPETDQLMNFAGASAPERELYSKITKRIEESLLSLEMDSADDIILCEWAPWARVKGSGVIHDSEGKHRPPPA